MERKPPQRTRSFDELSPHEKVKAILGVVQSPVSPTFATYLAGMYYEALEDEDRAVIDALFTSEAVQPHEDKHGGDARYTLTPEAKAELSTTVDFASAEREYTAIMQDYERNQQSFWHDE